MTQINTPVRPGFGFGVRPAAPAAAAAQAPIVRTPDVPVAVAAVHSAAPVPQKGELASLVMPGGVASLRELEGEGTVLFVDLDGSDQEHFADRPSFLAFADARKLPANVVKTVLEICEGEGALLEIKMGAPQASSEGVLDPEWALHPHEFHVSQTWEEMSQEQRAVKQQLVADGMPTALPLDAPFQLRHAARLPAGGTVVVAERVQQPHVDLVSLPSAYAHLENDILRVREPNRHFAHTTFGGAEGFARWAAERLSASDIANVNEFARAHVPGWAEEEKRLRQADLKMEPAAGAQHGNGQPTLKESIMTAAETKAAPADTATAGKPKGASPILRATVRNETSGEYETVLFLEPVKKEGSKAIARGNAFGERVLMFINHVKEGGAAFVVLDKEGADGKFERVAVGNAINSHKEGSKQPCNFDTVLFKKVNAEGKVTRDSESVFARITKAMSDELHKEIGFTSARIARTRPEPAEAPAAAEEPAGEDESERAAGPRG